MQTVSENYDTSVRESIAELVVQIVRGQVSPDAEIKDETALEDWGCLGIIDATNEEVAEAVAEAFEIYDEIQDTPSVSHPDLRNLLLGRVAA
jgi:hypothetical protein